MTLRQRSAAEELMDRPDTSAPDLARCLNDLAAVNRITLTHRATLRWLALQTAELQPGDRFRLLDVACGQGDFLRAACRWATARGLEPDLVGLDLNPRSVAEARKATPATLPIRYVTGDVFDYAPDPRPDWIVSSQFAHHLSDAAVVRFVGWMNQCAGRGWHIADLRRHWVPYYGFRLLCRIAGWHPLVRHDGTVSIARSFRIAEWQALLKRAGTEATVAAHFPFRVCIARTR
jgi:SAM-dependent methyltransferase